MKKIASIIAFLGIVASIDALSAKQHGVVEGVLLHLNESGTNAVEISIGNDDGVKIGDTLVVSRKDKRLGVLKASQVGHDRSTARIFRVEEGVVLQTGDRVAIKPE